MSNLVEMRAKLVESIREKRVALAGYESAADVYRHQRRMQSIHFRPWQLTEAETMCNCTRLFIVELETILADLNALFVQQIAGAVQDAVAKQKAARANVAADVTASVLANWQRYSGSVDRIAAGELRAFGFVLPEQIPDCATTPTSGMQLHANAAEAATDNMLALDLSLSLAEPFTWVDATFHIHNDIKHGGADAKS